MPSIGEQLRLAREKQGRSISELATATCISSRYIAAIEGDDRKGLPGDFFYRNFVKQYAGALGLDSRPLVKELDAVLPRDEQDVLPVLSGSYTPSGKTNSPEPYSRYRLISVAGHSHRRRRCFLLVVGEVAAPGSGGLHHREESR